MKFIFGEGFQRTLGGSMLVAGTAIGAGMLALPMTSAGMWFNWSMVLMLLSWFCMLRASQAIAQLEAALGFPVFTRERRYIGVTALGGQVVEHARNMLSQLNTIRELAAHSPGQLSISDVHLVARPAARL